MARQKPINFVKLVFSILITIIFSFLMIKSDKFYKTTYNTAYIAPFFVHLDTDENVKVLSLDDIKAEGLDTDRGVIEYIVQPGDTLAGIAKRFGVTVRHLQKINHLKIGRPIRPGQKLYITDEENGFIYTVKKAQNVAVFAKKYGLDLNDLMTLNYIQDETEMLQTGQEIFINIPLEEAYKKGLLKRPKVVPYVTKTAYRPIITTAKRVTSSSSKTYVSPSRVAVSKKTSSKVIRQWVFTKQIRNGFYPGHCTWGAAILTPEIFPYKDEYHQIRPFNGDARLWYNNAQKAGFKVGHIPRVGALVVYRRGYVPGAGHVGKVVAVYPSERKFIVRDMNYTKRFVFTDRWDSYDNPNIIGYIYIPAKPWKPGEKPVY